MSHRINASTIILNCTPLAWPKNFCAVPMIPHNVYYYSPYLFACFTFLLVEKNRFRTACFFFLRSAPWTISLAAVSVISTASAASATATTSLVWWSSSRRRIRSSSSSSNGSYLWQCCSHRHISLHLRWTALDWKNLKWTIWLSPSLCQNSHYLADCPAIDSCRTV